MGMTGLYCDLQNLGISPEKLKAAAGNGAALAAATATTAQAGLVKQAVAMANLGAAPTQANFNNLLQILRDAGVLAP